MKVLADPSVIHGKKMRDALCEKFLPSNSSWVARDRLEWLEQVGSIQDYVNEFCL